MAIKPFKVIQGTDFGTNRTRFRYQSKAHIRHPIIG